MHLMLSIDFESASSEEVERLAGQMTACMADLPHHRVFPHCWVVQVAGYGIYEILHRDLRAAADGIETCTVRFLMSPLLNVAPYRGRITEEAAKNITQFSKAES